MLRKLLLASSLLQYAFDPKAATTMQMVIRLSGNAFTASVQRILAMPYYVTSGIASRSISISLGFTLTSVRQLPSESRFVRCALPNDGRAVGLVRNAKDAIFVQSCDISDRPTRRSKNAVLIDICSPLKQSPPTFGRPCEATLSPLASGAVAWRR